MIGVLIVPTGIGAAIGGHAGDANPIAKLFGAVCEKLILHPNVVNASDINEMPDNALYVEGSMLDRFLWGEISLREVKRQNKVLVVANRPVEQDTLNAVAASRVTIGANVEILALNTPLRMVARFSPDGRATGDVFGWQELIEQVAGVNFDALAIHTPIDCPREVALAYYRDGGVNPWGGVEAVASKLIANEISKPVAHAPKETVTPDDEELYFINVARVDERMAPEAISNTYLHSVLRGLNRAPQIGADLTVSDVDFLLSPCGCWGPPHEACSEAGIPIIMVNENSTILNCKPQGEVLVVDNYLEAAGLVSCWEAGVSPASVRANLGGPDA